LRTQAPLSSELGHATIACVAGTQYSIGMLNGQQASAKRWPVSVIGCASRSQYESYWEGQREALACCPCEA